MPFKGFLCFIYLLPKLVAQIIESVRPTIYKDEIYLNPKFERIFPSNTVRS